jgi:hypothetical protein
MTAIDTTTSQGQLHLRAELDRRKLRLQRDSDGTYRLEQWRYGSITESGRECITPIPHWATIATFPNLAAVATGLGDIDT